MIKLPLIEVFPKTEQLDILKIPQDSVYIGVAGFEGRCFAFLEKCILNKIKFQCILGIKYEPFDEKNNILYFEKLAMETTYNYEHEWIIYNRHSPEDFSNAFTSTYDQLNINKNILVDISGMSKFLIVIILDKLKEYQGNIHIIYSEADIYHPLREEYESKKENLREDTFPSFLTTNVFNIVTTTGLSSTSMQGYPLLLIAFPTFNYKDMYALLNEITPQYLFKLEGKPKEQEYQWRLEALRWINRKLNLDFNPNIKGIYEKELSTFSYVDTIEILYQIYETYKYTHKCIITPTGSKLQSLGVLLFKQIFPEIQLVYPVTSGYLNEYSEGCKQIWHIEFANYSGFMNKIASIRKIELQRLELILKELNEN